MIDKDELMKWVAALRPRIGKMSKEELQQVFAMMWQHGILAQQFHDISKCMIYWCRHPEDRDALKGEAMTHLADCMCQIEIVCRLFELDDRQIGESRQLALERLKDHFLHEILPKVQKEKSKNQRIVA